MKKLTVILSALLFQSVMLIAGAQSSVVVVPLGGDTYQAGVANTGQTTCYKSPGVLIPCSDPEGLGQFAIV